MLEMSKYLGTQSVRDNIVVINGLTVKVDDTVAKYILDNCDIQSVSSTPTTPVVETKKQYVAEKDFVAKYKVATYINKVDNKEYYCIARANGWTKAEKKCANNIIKAIKGINEIEVDGTKKDGSKFTFKAWGFSTKATADKHCKAIDNTTISAEELNK